MERTGEVPKHELSKLEMKLRKQIQFSSTTSRHMEARWKNMELIRNIIMEPARRNRPIQKKKPRERVPRDDNPRGDL